MAYSGGGESSSCSDTFHSTPEWKYDVFLSFAGNDTRLKFVDHLDEAFKRSGIKTFRDDADLERGGVIKQDLSQAIKDSLCAVVIISENYANSTWCLDELQKILESQNPLDRRVFPVFYDVDPADVRHQRKRFREALDEHEEKSIENKIKVQNWRNALFEIASLSGWDSRGEHEADLIKNIVGKVWTYLSPKLAYHDDNLVGIESRVNDMVPILEIGLDDKRFVGIWGMGGAGKTTLARVLSENLRHKFEVCCFMANVKETLLQRDGLVCLQKRLLSKLTREIISDDHEGMKMIRKLLGNKKVLLVLDDLDNKSQLKKLAESPNWFGKGSRVIITTRSTQLLTSVGVGQRIYEMKTMKEDESLQLFSNHAFNKVLPEGNYLELSKYVVEYAGGLPLALEVLGSFLCGRSEGEWRDALHRMKKIPDKNILKVLKISYDGLNEEEKTIFLDIACFFKGWLTKKEVTRILEACDLHPTIGINELIQKALLVETEKGTLEMHDLLEELAKDIINRESGNRCNRSRLWEFEDIKKALENNQGTEAIEAMVGHFSGQMQDKIKVHPEAFTKMRNIRVLYFKGFGPFTLPTELNHFGGSTLKFVHWESFPSKALPLAWDGLVSINMTCSRIEQLWDGNLMMDKLKFINLSYSCYFSITPDFSRVPSLRYLRLHKCTSLVEVHHSLGKLQKLAEVDLSYCHNLKILPRKLETNSLIKLDLRWCTKVTALPEFGEDMKELSYLDVSETAITKLPESIGYLTGLRDLRLSGCKVVNLAKVLKTYITRQIYGLKVTSLTELYLNRCGLNDGSIPDDFGSLSSLIVLDLSANYFVNLPTDCISRLSRLLFLSLDYCWHLKSLPRLPPRLVLLTANCDSLEALSERHSWNLVASVVHEYRGQTKYVISCGDDDDDDDDFPPWMPKHFDPNCLIPLRDFCAIIQGSKIPSWFTNKGDFRLGEGVAREHAYEIKVNILPHLHDSEWLGIVVCFRIPSSHDFNIRWSSKGAEDDDYIKKEWAQHIFCSTYPGCTCIMVLELNEETCWKHLTPHNNTLHIKLDMILFSAIGGKLRWRVICKEEIQKWCNDNHFTQPQLPSPHHHDAMKIPSRVFKKFIRKAWW